MKQTAENNHDAGKCGITQRQSAACINERLLTIN